MGADADGESVRVVGDGEGAGKGHEGGEEG